MRRLVVEIPLKDFANFHQGDSHFQSIKTAEVLYFLRQDQEEFAIIFRIQLKNSDFNVEDIIRELHGKEIEMQLLEGDDGGKGCFTYFVRGTLHKISGYLTTPFEVKDGNLRFTLLGNASQVRDFLEDTEKTGIQFKVVSLTDARFTFDSPLSSLTDRQREVLVTAYKLGYYDRPRKISSKKLAEQLNLSSSTLVAHRLKAERRLLAAVLDNK